MSWFRLGIIDPNLTGSYVSSPEYAVGVLSRAVCCMSEAYCFIFSANLRMLSYLQKISVPVSLHWAIQPSCFFSSSTLHVLSVLLEFCGSRGSRSRGPKSRGRRSRGGRLGPQIRRPRPRTRPLSSPPGNAAVAGSSETTDTDYFARARPLRPARPRCRRRRNMRFKINKLKLLETCCVLFNY